MIPEQFNKTNTTKQSPIFISNKRFKLYSRSSLCRRALNIILNICVYFVLFFIISSESFADPKPSAMNLDDFFSGKVNASFSKKLCDDMPNKMSNNSICQQCSEALCSISYKELKNWVELYLDSIYSYDEDEEKVEHDIKKENVTCGHSKSMNSMLLTIGSGDSVALLLASDAHGVYIKHYQILSDRIYSYSPIGKNKNLIFMYTNTGNAGLDYETDYFLLNEQCEINLTFSFSCSDYAFDENGHEYHPEVSLGQFSMNGATVAEYPCVPMLGKCTSYSIFANNCESVSEPIDPYEDDEANEYAEKMRRSARDLEFVLQYFKALLSHNFSEQLKLLNSNGFSHLWNKKVLHNCV